MVALIDTSNFPVVRNLDYESPEELAELHALKVEAGLLLGNGSRAPPVAELILAFGLGKVIGLFLARFSYARKREDAERWVVVGNLPAMHFETDDTPTPALALELYCAIAQDWADNVLQGRDLSDSYPIDVAPTREHAEMLWGRIEFIRNDLIPLI
jgi:hypothetical protein